MEDDSSSLKLSADRNIFQKYSLTPEANATGRRGWRKKARKVLLASGLYSKQAW